MMKETNILLLALGMTVAGSAIGVTVGLKAGNQAPAAPSNGQQMDLSQQNAPSPSLPTGTAQQNAPSPSLPTGTAQPVAPSGLSVDSEVKLRGYVKTVNSGSLEIVSSNPGSKSLRVLIGPKTILTKYLPKTMTEIIKENGQESLYANWDISRGPPPPPLSDDPYKSLPMKAADFAKDDLVEIVVEGEFKPDEDVRARSISWLYNQRTGYGIPADAGSPPPGYKPGDPPPGAEKTVAPKTQ